jgi:hypothetical protein
MPDNGHLTKHRIGHLSKPKIDHLADAAAMQLCYTGEAD